MVLVISTIGIPGIGKSSVLRLLMSKLPQSSNVKYFSSDEYKGNKVKMFKDINNLLSGNIDKNLVIVLDRCNMSSVHRLELINKIKADKYIFANFMSTYDNVTNKKIANDRIKLRGEEHPTLKYSPSTKIIISKMMKVYEEPKFDTDHNVLIVDVDPINSIDVITGNVLKCLS